MERSPVGDRVLCMEIPIMCSDDMQSRQRDVEMLRELARRYADVCSDPVQATRRDLWRKKNSLIHTRPLIYMRAFAWDEMAESRCECGDPLFRTIENQLRKKLFWASLDDDSVFEPWVDVSPVYECTGWGVESQRRIAGDGTGSYKEVYPLGELADIEKLVLPWHGIDEPATAVNVRMVTDAIGDILTINLDRGPFFRAFYGDISMYLGHLRGMENFMLDMFDNPQLLHGLLAYMRDGVLATHEQAETRGDWCLTSHENQAMCYADELPDPAANSPGAKREQLWCFMAAQEYSLVSPEMHEEFLLRYQMPIMEKFGLVAYGCCEDLTRKIDMLHTIRNLRRIAVSPFADLDACADQIGTDYVISYRPSPTDMVGYGFDPERITDILSRDLNACVGRHVDITLKDVETVQRDPTRARQWVCLARQAIDSVWR